MIASLSSSPNKLIAPAVALRRLGVFCMVGGGGGAGELRRSGGSGGASASAMAWRQNGGNPRFFGALLGRVGMGLVGMADKGRGFPPKTAACPFMASVATSARIEPIPGGMGGVSGQFRGGGDPLRPARAPSYLAGSARAVPLAKAGFSADGVTKPALNILTACDLSARNLPIEPTGRGKSPARPDNSTDAKRAKFAVVGLIMGWGSKGPSGSEQGQGHRL